MAVSSTCRKVKLKKKLRLTFSFRHNFKNMSLSTNITISGSTFKNFVIKWGISATQLNVNMYQKTLNKSSLIIYCIMECHKCITNDISAFQIEHKDNKYNINRKQNQQKKLIDWSSYRHRIQRQDTQQLSIYCAFGDFTII